MDEKAMDAFADEQVVGDLTEDEAEALEATEKTEEESQEEAQATPAEKGDEKEHWTKKAALDERRKRQALEKEMGELRNKVSYLEGAASMLEDDEAEDDDDDFDYGDLSASTRKIVAGQLDAQQQAREAKENQEWQTFVADCMEDAREKHEDADEVIDHYLKMEKSDPSLARRVRRQANPVEWAYQRAKAKMEEGDEVSDLRKRIAELEARPDGEPLDEPEEPKQRKRLASKRGTGTKAAKPELLSAEDVFSDAFGR